MQFFPKLRVQHPVGHWETLPYDSFSPHQDIISQRLRRSITRSRHASGPTLDHSSRHLMPVTHATAELHRPFQSTGQTVDRLDLHGLRRRLEQAGYNAVEQVLEHGEFTPASLLIFPMGSKEPYRTTSSMMKSIPSEPSIRIANAPASLLPPYACCQPTKFRDGQRHRAVPRPLPGALRDQPGPECIYQQVSKGLWLAGIEYYLPSLS